MIDSYALDIHDTVLENTDPLKLELENDEFIHVINASIDASTSYYKGKRLYDRQDKNVGYYMGEQIPEAGLRVLAPYQTRYVENIVYEGVRRVKPIATSRLPDLVIKRGQSPEVEKLMTDVINTDIKRRENRKVLGLAHVHEQLFFYAVIKAHWNPEKGDDGDYEFLNRYPKNIVWDHRCKTSSADDMRFVAENTEMTVKEAVMMFPDAKEDLLEALGFTDDDKVNEKKMASPITIWEVWFHWYKETKDQMTNKSKWEKVDAVVWKYQNTVLAKMRNPYFDYEGKTMLFDPTMKEHTKPTEEQMMQAFMGDLQLGSQTVYHNYFKRPRKPYFFMVYESLGQDPIDATNRIEQVLSFQDHINDEGRQIIDMNERSAGKPIFNTEALDAKIIKNLDWRNMKQAIGVNGDDVNKAFAFAQMPAAPSQLYQSKESNRAIAFEMIGVNATTRGVKEGSDQTLGQSQMYREQDFGFIDDLVEETINDAAEWIAQWSMQFIKVFYTTDHYKEVAGKDGESLSTAVNQDLVDDGMVVEVSASAVDKLRRKQMATQNMQLKVGDILSYYEDTEQSNPKERAYRAFLQINAPQMYAQQYLVPEGSAGQPQMTGQPMQPGQPPAQGQPMTPPSQPPQAPMGGMGEQPPQSPQSPVNAPM